MVAPNVEPGHVALPPGHYPVVLLPLPPVLGGAKVAGLSLGEVSPAHHQLWPDDGETVLHKLMKLEQHNDWHEALRCCNENVLTDQQ